MNIRSDLKVKVVRKIDQISPEEWVSVFPAVLENYYFFKTIDQSSFDQFSFFYIIVYENGIPVGATSCFLMRFPFDMTVQGPLKIFLGLIKKFLPNILSPKVLVCGLPMAQGRIGITGNPHTILESICNCMEKIAKEEKAAMFIFKDFTSTYDKILLPLLKKGFTKIESIPSTDMNIRFSSFDEYLKTLGRVSRDGLKRNFKKVDVMEKIDLDITSALEDNVLPQVYGLYLQTFEKQDMGLEKLPMDFFKRISENMPKEVKYFLWRIDGKLVAFALCLTRGDYFIDYYLGFDYSVAHKYHLYFIRFRDLMKWCIANGIKKYEMGVTTYEPKRRLGFDFIRLYFYMKHRNPIINPFLNIIGHFIKPENFDPIFKEMNKR